MAEVAQSATIETKDQTLEEQTLMTEMDPFKQSLGSNLLMLMQHNNKKKKNARRFNFKVDFEEIDRIMEEEESGPIVMPV